MRSRWKSAPLPRGRLPAGFLIGLFLVFSPAALSQPTATFDTTEYETATSMILCDCGCHPQSVHDCACGRAAEMRREIQGMIVRGMSGEQVIAHYVDQVGDHIRIVPTAEGFNLLAWLGPLAALLVGSLVMILVIRRWSRPAADPSAIVDEELPPDADDGYRQRLRDALENLE